MAARTPKLPIRVESQVVRGPVVAPVPVPVVVVDPSVGVAGGVVGPTSSVVGPTRIYFECSVCKCRGTVRTQCGICGRRNCMTEVVEPVLPGAMPGGVGVVPGAEVKTRGSLQLAIKESTKIVRRRSGLPKLDKVLGGGYVDKTSILIAGDPGAGKSTLLMQACVAFAGPQKPKKVKGAPPVEEKEPEIFRTLYCSGEEALEQVGGRAGRIPHADVKGEWIELVSTRSVPEIMGAILDIRPHLVVVDSVQEVGDEALAGRFGGENQVANAIRSTMKCIRENGFGTAIFVCHVRKDGDIAGAKKAEHLVDVTCKLSIALREEEDEEEEDLPEDEKTVHDERYLEAYKNRYGSITERAVFTMTEQGLR
jgi:DNA repair protein RadA/Sms